jgi:hypothetical protein
VACEEVVVATDGLGTAGVAKALDNNKCTLDVKRQVESVVHWPAPPMAMQVASYRRAAGRWIAFGIYEHTRCYFPSSGLGVRRGKGNCKSEVKERVPLFARHCCVQIANCDMRRCDGMGWDVSPTCSCISVRQMLGGRVSNSKLPRATATTRARQILVPGQIDRQTDREGALTKMQSQKNS